MVAYSWARGPVGDFRSTKSTPPFSTRHPQDLVIPRDKFGFILSYGQRNRTAEVETLSEVTRPPPLHFGKSAGDSTLPLDAGVTTHEDAVPTAPERLPHSNPASDPWVFAEYGEQYYIAGASGGAYFRKLKSFNQLFRMVCSIGVPVTMQELDASQNERGRSRQSAIDEKALLEYKASLAESRAERERARADNDEAEVARLDADIDMLSGELARSINLNGEPYELQSWKDKLRSRIHASLNRAYDKLRDASPPLTDLAKHFKSSIRAQGASFIYQPAERPCWQHVIPEAK